MSNFSKILKGIGILAAVVVLGALIGYWASSSGTRNAPSNPTTEAVKEAHAIPTPAPAPNQRKREIVTTTASPGETSKPDRKPPPVTINATPGVTPPVATNQIPDWEEKVDTILTSEDPDPEKAKKMLAMFPLLTGDAQEEVAHHISNLIEDENYSAFGQYLTNSSLPEEVLDVLLEDVLNRPNSIKLPMLLEVARDPQNPKANEAKDVLELFLEEDYGVDWVKWESKTKEWLKENPD